MTTQSASYVHRIEAAMHAAAALVDHNFDLGAQIACLRETTSPSRGGAGSTTTTTDLPFGGRNRICRGVARSAEERMSSGAKAVTLHMQIEPDFFSGEPREREVPLER